MSHFDYNRALLKQPPSSDNARRWLDGSGRVQDLPTKWSLMLDVQKCIEGTRRKAAFRKSLPWERAKLLEEARALIAAGKSDEARMLAGAYFAGRVWDSLSERVESGAPTGIVNALDGN